MTRNQEFKAIVGSMLALFFMGCENMQSPTSIDSNWKEREVLTTEHVAPPFWWVDMTNDTLQILVHAEDIALADFEGIDPQPKWFEASPSPHSNNYYIVDLSTSGLADGDIQLLFAKDGEEWRLPYSLKERNSDNKSLMGLNSADVIYLLMPDRFANGDASNDVVSGMEMSPVVLNKDLDHMTPEKRASYENNEDVSLVALNRDLMYSRHGGDLQGVIDHLDYIQELGMTAIWLNPFVENNQPYESYHGYAITDHYEVDPRLGDLEVCKEMIDASHERGMKIVMDIIHNHVGDRHFLFTDMPDSACFHHWDGFHRTTYRAPTVMDPYASQADRNLMLEGWFDTHMPDLNQENEIVAQYLIQNNIWWIEYMGIDAFRMDTYAYSDPPFLKRWHRRINEEYPDFFSFGETWVHGTPVQAYFHGETILDKAFNSGPEGLTDFQLYYAINEALSQEQSWTGGAARVYFTLAKDYIYHAPSNNVVFLDNHDLSRFYSMVGENDEKFLTGLTFLFTTRGIPMIYYGTEIGMKNYTDPDGRVREDFPGGWPGDETDKFKESGRSETEQKYFSFIQQLALLRQESKALSVGDMIQFVPQDGLYVYSRFDDEDVYLIALNFSEGEKKIDFERYKELIGEKETAIDVFTQESVSLGEDVSIAPWGRLVVQFPR